MDAIVLLYLLGALVAWFLGIGWIYTENRHTTRTADIGFEIVLVTLLASLWWMLAGFALVGSVLYLIVTRGVFPLFAAAERRLAGNA